MFLVININGNLLQIANTGQTVTNANTVQQAAVNTAATTVVPQAATLANTVTTSANQLGVSNGNIVMVRNNTDVRNRSFGNAVSTLNLVQSVTV